MTTTNSVPGGTCTPEQVDEAAVWMTLLHASDRSAHTDRGFRRWLEAHPAHAVAFEKVSIAHEITAGLPRGPFPRLTRWERAGFRAGFVRAAGVFAATLLLAVGGLFFYWRSSGIGTDVGEQRVLTLADGSQVFLNTDTRIVIHYDESMRRVQLKRGEALFDVARDDPKRPFVVVVGGHEIKALGTSFLIRRDPEKMAVTLIEGKVSVSEALRKQTPTEADQATGGGEGVVLAPGQRLTFDDGRGPELDRPALSKLTAWRTGHVQFDRTPLVDAVAEMNRYSTVKVDLERPEAARISITGNFRANATRSFALAVAAAYHLQVIEGPNIIRLVGVPGPANTPASAPVIVPDR